MGTGANNIPSTLTKAESPSATPSNTTEDGLRGQATSSVIESSEESLDTLVEQNIKVIDSMQAEVTAALTDFRDQEVTLMSDAHIIASRKAEEKLAAARQNSALWSHALHARIQQFEDKAQKSSKELEAKTRRLTEAEGEIEGLRQRVTAAEEKVE